MKKQSFSVFFLIVLFLFCLSCSTNKSSDGKEYPYETEFKRYMHEVHSAKLDEKVIYYLLDLKSCDPCIEANLGLLSSMSSNEKLIPVIIGRPRYDVWNDQIAQVLRKFRTLTDVDSEALLFELGMSKPLIISIKNESVNDFMTVSDFEIEKAREFLLKHL